MNNGLNISIQNDYLHLKMQAFLPAQYYLKKQEAAIEAQKNINDSNDSKTDITEIFKKILTKFEARKPQNINAIQISKTYKLQHRRVYDLINFISSFGVCKAYEKRRVGWRGLENFDITLQKKYIELEIKSLTVPFKALFSLGPSPSLGTIGTKLLCLFCYLGTECLTMKSIIALFHDRLNDTKSIERRVYLVISFLDVLGKISKGRNRGEYVVKIDMISMVKKGLKARLEESRKLFPYNIDSLMADDSLSYRYCIYNQRRREFQDAIGH